MNRDLLVFGKAGSPARVFLNDGTGHFGDGALLPPVEANAAIGKAMARLFTYRGRPRETSWVSAIASAFADDSDPAAQLGCPGGPKGKP